MAHHQLLVQVALHYTALAAGQSTHTPAAPPRRTCGGGQLLSTLAALRRHGLLQAAVAAGHAGRPLRGVTILCQFLVAQVTGKALATAGEAQPAVAVPASRGRARGTGEGRQTGLWASRHWPPNYSQLMLHRQQRIAIKPHLVRPWKHTQDPPVVLAGALVWQRLPQLQRLMGADGCSRAGPWLLLLLLPASCAAAPAVLLSAGGRVWHKPRRRELEAHGCVAGAAGAVVPAPYHHAAKGGACRAVAALPRQHGWKQV